MERHSCGCSVLNARSALPHNRKQQRTKIRGGKFLCSFLSSHFLFLKVLLGSAG